MSAKPRTDCTIISVAVGLYHIGAPGSDEPIATVKRLPTNSFYRRWGARLYGQDLDPWVPRSTMSEAVDYAVAHFLTPHVPRETKEV